MLHSPFYLLHSLRGQAALSLVFLIGGIAILVSITLVFLVTSFIGVSFGFQASERASAVATAGAEDGLIQLARNKGFSDTTGYSVPLGSDSATVTVTQNSPSAGQATVLSTATVSGNRRRIRLVASVDALTGEVRVLSREQIAL